MSTLKALKQILTSTVLTVVTLTSHSFAASGGSSTGGGYAYEDTTIKHLRVAQHELVSAIQALNQEDINVITKPYSNEIFEKKKLTSYIKGIELAELDNGKRIKNGHERVLDMDYSFEDGGYIKALKPFFEAFNKLNLTPQEQNIMKRKIIHEISHLFNVGINDNRQSLLLSEELVRFLKYPAVRCGGFGTIEERLRDCEDKNIRVKRANSQLVMDAFGNLGSYEITDSRSKFGYFVSEQVVEMFSFLGHDLIINAEEVCQRVNALDGQLTWRPTTLEEIEQISPIDPNKNYHGSNDIDALANGKVRFIKDGGLFSKTESHIAEITNDLRVKTKKLKVTCLGTLN